MLPVILVLTVLLALPLIDTGAHRRAVTCYELQRDEPLVNVTERVSASMPSAETVSETYTLC